MARKYDTSRKKGETLEQQYKRLAKVADQRLVRLERLSQDPNFENVLSWSYNKAMNNLKKYGNSTRFNTKMPRTQQGIQAKIRKMEEFINSPTSTKAGIKNIYKKRANTINKRYGTTFTWETLAKYYETGIAEKLDKKLASKTALLMVAKIQKLDNDVINSIKDVDSKVIKLSNNNAINNKMNEFIRENDIDWSQLRK